MAPTARRPLNRGKVTLAGVAPMDNQSGKRDGPRSIYGGRPDVRAALYMAALVALMRKIIVLANALIRDQREYDPAL
ncbi:transposase [Nitrospirillum sp. BR 11828]|uniref:transposase n=1 Tax=Nitrospirillum sp. BR 11828 TaxID=3104325 RepID=UPI003A101765